MPKQIDWPAIARHAVAVVLMLLGTYGITVTYSPKTAPVQSPQPVIFQPAPATPTPILAPQVTPPATGAGIGAEDLAILAVLRGPAYSTLRKQLVEVSAVK